MIITIDGPSATGKSTIAHLLANELGISHLSTGIIYRAIAYLLKEQEIESLNFIQKSSLSELKQILYFEDWSYRFDSIAKYAFNVKEFDITSHLVHPDIAAFASLISTVKTIRELANCYARQYAEINSLVADGRDCGTEVFRDSNYKFFLTADLLVRARRWQQALIANNLFLTLEKAIQEIQSRDERDIGRINSPLKMASQAHLIDTSNMTISQVLGAINGLLKS